MTGRKLKSSRPLYLLLLTVALISPFLFPDLSWAVQQHGGAEGLVSHQIGHILFITGMLFLLYRLIRFPSDGPGWIEFKIFILLVTLWNILTFYGHWHRELIDQSKFIRLDGKVTAFTITDPIDILFYLSRLDHLLLVPAFLFLLFALIKWRRQA